MSTSGCGARWFGRRFAVLLGVCAVLARAGGVGAQVQRVSVVSDAAGMRLQVDGRDFLVKGVNWDYFPIGENYAYNFWGQPDGFIEAALAREMPLLRAMGVNAIRQYAGVPPRWVRYIYERYGIYTVLNHALGRYGVTVNGVYSAQTDYSNPQVRAALLGEVTALVEQFRGTPGVLLWLLGNENNYALEWRSAETENLPAGERQAARARHMYSLFGEVARAVKALDPNHPVALANGDVQYLDIIAQEARGLDVFGANVYRGISFGDLFQRVRDQLGLPVLLTEFGADAWNAREGREDQVTQARYLLGQWQEIYEQSAGKGQAGNAIGGFTFQWTDGWWKTGQETRLDVHDVTGAWFNAGYPEDYTPGENNMNEEWWGITAKGPPDARGLFDLYPRAAYYALQRVNALEPYAPGVDVAAIRQHFRGIEPAAMALLARGDQAALAAARQERFRLAGLRLQLETFSTGGTLIRTPREAVANSVQRPSFRGFDHLESFYADLEAQPAPNLSAALSLNVLGHVPENPIDEIFYENRGRRRVVETPGEPLAVTDFERLRVYRASFMWDERWFRVDGFYRTGHYHWGYEGDLFGLYREANYGPNIDIYNGDAPLGAEFAGKRGLDGLKVAFGPELWWGANPAVLAKYRHKVGPFTATAIYHEDLARQATATSSFAVPVPPVRRATLALTATRGPLTLDLGGIWGGNTKFGDAFQVLEGDEGSYRVLQDSIRPSDAWGGTLKLTYQGGRFNWYGQASAMGLVADAGPTSVVTFTGWQLRSTGSGNVRSLLTGVALNLGKLQVAPNFLWQKPVVGPIPADVPAPGRPRNILSDPFAVRANRETVAGELMLSFDPTPATWMYAWDNDVREDAKLAFSIGATVRHLPTTQDAAIGILADGRTIFAFPGAAPARDLWETRARVIARPLGGLRLIANLYGGTAEPNGSDARLIHRYGGDVRAVQGSTKLVAAARFNDWGPFDYHRDFNLTYPQQYSADLSRTLGNPSWFALPQTSIGIRGTWRSLDRYSPRYCPARITNPVTGLLTCDPTAPGDEGSEWEIRTYLRIGL
ncbi:MAG: glycosidase [Gemmatimonadetes bacterium]|nr:glycosidase [Gemmatimonadota bacterium]